MTSGDVEAAREAVIKAARKIRHAESDVELRRAEIALSTATKALDELEAAPPLPERRQWTVTTETRPALRGEHFIRDRGGLVPRLDQRSVIDATPVKVVVSVEPVGENTVTLEPGQFVGQIDGINLQDVEVVQAYREPQP